MMDNIRHKLTKRKTPNHINWKQQKLKLKLSFCQDLTQLHGLLIFTQGIQFGSLLSR